MSWIERLKHKWGLKSLWQVVIVLLVFALTGTTILLIKAPIKSLIGASGVWYTVLYFICILPIYNIVLLCYGFLFGQFHFFWAFEKRMFRRMIGQKDAGKNPSH